MIPYGKQSIDEDDIAAVVEVLQSDFLTTGPKVTEFENALCKYTGAKFAVAVANGTAALHLASLALLKKGAKVLTTPNSFVATANSIVYVDAEPIFVDIGEDGNIDLDKCIDILKKESVDALYVVHFSGKPLDMEKLAYIKQRFGVKILEDAAHALGARYAGGKVGDCRYSDVATFSFHPVKSITTAEGGAIVTNDETLYHTVIQLRNHGIVREGFKNETLAKDAKGNINPWYYEMHHLGYNYRITDLQCALGISQIKKIDTFIQRRQEIAQRYDMALKDSPMKPLYSFDEKSAYHLYVVRYDFANAPITKAELFYKMKERGIALQLHYIPIYWQPYYRKRGYDMMLPMMERYYQEAFSLPIYPTLKESEQMYVVEQLVEVLHR